MSLFDGCDDLIDKHLKIPQEWRGNPPKYKSRNSLNLMTDDNLPDGTALIRDLYGRMMCNWIGGDWPPNTSPENWRFNDSKASTFEARSNLHDAPISYSIRTIVPAEPKLPFDVMAKYPDAIGKDVPAFRVIVDVDFKSQAGTPLTKVVEYNVTWVNEMNDWAIREKY